MRFDGQGKQTQNSENQMFGGVFGLEGTQRQIEEDSGIFWHNAMSSLGSRKTEMGIIVKTQPNSTQLKAAQKQLR